MVTIVTSHWKEDLEWLNNSGHKVILIDKEGAEPTCIQPKAVVPNVCGETPVYLKYIIDNYDTLPPVVAFVHGHEFAYHHKHPLHILDLIENLDVKGYISLNGTWRTIPNIDDPNHDFIKLRKYWHLIEPVVGPYPPMYGIACANSQFLVTRERIRRVPLAFYKHWYDQVLKDGTIYIQTFFEYTWHVIFGEPWVMQFQAFLPLKTGLLRPRPTFIQEMHIP
jgi:Protein of unknown function (DUF3431)